MEEQLKYPDGMLENITDEFLVTLKNELDTTFNYCRKPMQTTYWNFYQWFDNTTGFDQAFKATCNIHKLYELYNYRNSFLNIDINIYDALGVELTEMLYKRGIIEKGDSEHALPVPW